MAEPSFGPGPGPFSSDSSPWVWVLIPVGIVIAIGALAVCLHSKRRQRLASYLHSTAPSPPPNAQPPESRSRAINERDLEEAWVRGAPPTQNVAIPAPGGRWANSNGTNSRWYWAGSEPRRGLSRPEEGLNELGEAPPPYEKSKKPHSPPPNLNNLNPNGEGPAPKSGPTSSAPSLHRGFGVGTATTFEEMEMHTLAPAMTGRTLTTLATEQSTASSVSDGVGRSVTDPLSPFTLSSVPSTVASSVHERGLSPPPYDGPAAFAFAPAPTPGPVELLATPVPGLAPAPEVEDGEDEDNDIDHSSRSSLSSNLSSTISGMVTPPEPAVLAEERER